MQSTLTRPRTDRSRGGNAYTERKTNAWAAFIGFMLGRGHSSPAIAEMLNDDTTAETIRHMARKWGLPSWGRSSDCFVVIPMKQRDRALLAARAAQEGLGMEEYCRRFIVAGSTQRATYSQIVGKDQFE